MGKDKTDKKKMHFPERIIHSSETIPKDQDSSFKRFVKKLSSKKVPYYNSEIEISELGPQEGLSTTFQVLGLMNMTFRFKIRFIISSSKLELGYEADSEYLMNVPKFAKRAGEQQITNAIMPRIMQAFNKSLEVKEKKPKEKKEKKPQDKEKKEKKPKDPLKLLKLKFVEGEISEEEYLRKKKLLEG